MDLVLSHKVHGETVNGVRQILQGPVGSVRRVDDLLRLRFREGLVELLSKGGLVLFFGRQVAFHATDKGPGAQGHVVQILLALFRRHSGTVVVRVGHADEIAGAVDVQSPVLSGFVPTLVGCVGTEHCVQKQGRQ